MKYVYYIKHDTQYIPYLHIAEFAARCHLNQATIRDMLVRKDKNDIGGGRWRRPLHYFRDGSTVFIPLSELYQYPFISGTNCYHYDDKGVRKLCVECTMGEGCEEMKKGRDLVLPQGDE